MSRIVLAVALLVLGAEAARADDDFKTCATGAPDYAIMACTNLIEGGKLDSRQQAIAYTNRGVAFRNRGGLNRALADLNRAIELAADQAPKGRASALQALSRPRCYAALAWTRPAALASAPGTSSSASSRAGSTGPGSTICPRGTGTKPNLP